MLLVLLYFSLHLLQPSSSIFPNHVDLQKVGEVTFNNEKYNVLRPSLHIVKDYFKDFILRRDSSDFPTKRIFMDDNGFRHYWSGIENKINLRKSDQSNIANKTTSRTVVTRKKPHRKKPFPATPEAKVLRASGNRTLAKTTFFCPFFGVVTMSTFLD